MPLPSTPRHPRPYGWPGLLPDFPAEGDAYEGRSIGCGRGEPAPTFDCLQTIHTAIGFQI